MKVIAYDPFLSPERARDLGVEKVELDELFKRADFITLHTPLTDKTSNIIDAAAHREDEEGRAHHQLRARRPGRRGGAARGAQGRPGRGRRLRRVRRGAGDAEPAVRPAQRGLHAASRRRHQRGAGERRAAGRRADVGLSAARRHLQCGQLPLDQRRGGAASSSPSSRSPRSSAPSPASSPRTGDQGSAHHLRGRGRADEHQGAHLGGARRPAAADAAATSTWCRRRWWRSERGIGGRGDHARGRRRLRKPDHRDGR